MGSFPIEGMWLLLQFLNFEIHTGKGDWLHFPTPSVYAYVHTRVCACLHACVRVSSHTCFYFPSHVKYFISTFTLQSPNYFFPPPSQTEPKNICPVISAAVNYTSPASRIPIYFLLAFCSCLSHKHKRIPLFPQETFLSADTKTCQHTSRFILPHYETAPLRVM